MTAEMNSISHSSGSQEDDMPDLGKAYVQIVPSAEGISGSISNLLGGEVESAGQQAGESLGSKLMGVAKKVIAAAGIGKAIAASLNEGGALQQSLGGVETLFKDNADRVKQYASQAYKTTGLSANQYMESVTGFSASLLQSLGGDTAKAADIANTAMVDMADNSNKMGTSMEAIQNAYAGFAKQNYTMLDNLKLGYGGTKTEMERLLKDATKLTGVKYDINSLSDVYEAIHAVQGELGITGTTAEEASKTLQGSFNAMKASFTDLLGAMSTGGDIGPQLEALATSASTWLFGNFIPMVTQILANVPQLIVGVFEEGLPLILEEGGKLLTSLQDGVILNLPTMAETALQTIMGFVNGLGTMLPNLITSGTEFINNLITGIVQTIPVLLSYVPQIISGLVTTITTNFPAIIKSGMDLITNLATGIWDNRESVWQYIKDIFHESLRLVTEIDWLGLGMDVINWIVDGVSALFDSIPTLLSEIAQLGWDLFKEIDWSGLGQTVIDLVVDGLDFLFNDIPDKLKSIAEDAWDAVTNIDWLGLGSDIVNGIIRGIGSMGGALWNSLKGLATSALEGAKKTLKIGSPSKVFEDDVGHWIPEGAAVGVEKNKEVLTDAMKDMAMDAAAVPVEQIITADRTWTAGTVPGNQSTVTNMGGVTINVNASDYDDDPVRIADAIDEMLTKKIDRDEAVFA